MELTNLTTIDWKQTPKQAEAWNYLNDTTTTEVLFGGGAGGAKSYLGCSWIIANCGRFKGSRWLIGRSKLKNLKHTTLRTFFEVCNAWGIKADVHYKYNAQDGVITFRSGSEVFLKDLFLYPSDPEFNSLGSLEITGAFIDEANQITAKAWEVVNSRIRYKLDQFGVVPKTLLTCNPDKNFVYSDFYKPWREHSLPEYRKFIQALAFDNPFLSQHYIEQLKRIRDKNTRERLLYGNWEYDDDPARLFDINDIYDMYNLVVNSDQNKKYSKYCSVDVARYGNDKTVIRIWSGFQSVKTITLEHCGTDKIVEKLKEIEQGWQIPRSHFVIDEDGVGGGVVDNFKGCIGFVNNARPLEDKNKSTNPFDKTNYANIKSQCYFMLAQKVEEGEIGITCEPTERELLTEELEVIKRLNMFDDTKRLEVTHKKEIRELIGRSPDYADTLMMRMVFELDKQPSLDSIRETVYNKSATYAGNLMKAKF